MLFVEDIVLVNETRHGVNAKLEIWRDALESKGFQLSRTKTKYEECKFSKSRNRDEGIIRLDGQEILKSESFRYLGSITHKDEKIKEYLNHRIREVWIKSRSASGVFVIVEYLSS